MQKVSVIECGDDSDLLIEITSTLHHALAGKPIFYSDNLRDLVNRHCPELYSIAEEAGYRFIPSEDNSELEKVPPEIWFDIIRKVDAKHLN